MAGTTTWSRTEEANIGLLNEKLRREAYHKTFWARFAGFTKILGSGKTRQVIPSGQPIEIMRDFVADGMDHMLVPMLLNLTGAGIFGDLQLEGNEEELDLYYNIVYINQVRNGIKTGGRISEQRLKALRLEREKMPLLSDWFAQWNEVSIARAFYEGYSQHISAAAASGGFYIGSGQKVPHPNFYTAGEGQVTWNATDATYETSIDTALGNVTDTATDYFTTDLLEALRVEVESLKLKPMVLKNGFEFFPVAIHPNQGRQLRASDDWKNSNQQAWVASMAKENPIFTGALGYYAGFVPYERMLGVFGASPDGAGTVTFGATNPISAPDTYARKCAIVFGRGAISRGVAEDLFFTREKYDHGNINAVGAGMIVGDARADFKDSTSSKTAVINQTSLVVSSYSDNSFV